nr:ABC transporter permease [Thalassotalea piscium]
MAESKKTYLSFLWWFFEPMLLMVIYYLVFGLILSVETEDFVSYLLIGLVVWQWLFRTVTNSANSITDAGSIIGKVSINKVFFPAVTVLTDAAKSLFVFLVLFLYLFIVGYEITSAYWVLPLLFASELLLVIAISLWAALIVPFLPDVKILINSVLMAMMFASGIFYSTDLIPPSIENYFYLNPMAYLIQCYRDVLLEGNVPDLVYLSKMTFVFIILILGALAFAKRFNNSYFKVVLR